MNRPSIRALPPREKERRWDQHLMSLGGLSNRGGNRTNLAAPQPRPATRRAGKKQEVKKDVCGMEYAASLLNPFDLTLNPCIPRFPSLPSRKFSTFSGGVGMTSTSNATGGVAAYLRASSDSASVVTTGATYTNLGIPYFSDTGAVSHNASSPYLDADIGATGVQVRLVSLGIQVRYIGTELNMGGLCYPIMEPDMASVQGFTASTITSYPEFTKPLKFDREWVAINYTPRDPKNFEFKPDPKPVVAHTPLGILIESASGAQPFEYKFAAHWEAIGRNARGKTISHTSPNTDKVLAGVAQVPAAVVSKVSNAVSPMKAAAKIGLEVLTTGAAVATTMGQVELGGAAGMAAAISSLL